MSGEGGAEDGLRLGNRRYAGTSGVLVERLYSDNRRCVRLADCGRAGQSGTGQESKGSVCGRSRDRLGLTGRRLKFRRSGNVYLKACAQLFESNNKA